MLEHRAAAETPSDRDPVPGAGVRAGQRPGAQLSVAHQGRWVHELHGRGAFRVPELTDVEIVLVIASAADLFGNGAIVAGSPA
jgi:hypothetical protein